MLEQKVIQRKNGAKTWGVINMFIQFFYLLRERGLKVSINEWLTLIEALDKGLCSSSLLDFYHLCRSIIVKSETEFDKFDRAFAQFFKGIETPADLPDEIWKWLDKELKFDSELVKLNANAKFKSYDLEELKDMLKKRMEEQNEEHNGGSYWIGTGGTSVMGHSGYNSNGIRIGGESRHKSAVQIAGERNFKDFRQDSVIDPRQYQMAFKKLRQFSSRVDSAKTELDIDGTIQKTCENARNLKLVWERPRQNTVKLILLFDSDGSMASYVDICSSLFKAVNKSNHFKDLKIYYFHNCVYDHLYTNPYCIRGQWVETEWVFNNLDNDYKVIIIGDGSMAPSELLSQRGNIYYSGPTNETAGIEWLKRIKRKYEKTIWLNPISKGNWEYVYGYYTIKLINDVFPMFDLTLDGLEAGIKKLIVSR